MSRWKRFAVGTILTIALLGGTTTLWYQTHYVDPLIAAPAPPLPSPNGFDTLEEAKRLECYHFIGRDGKPYFYSHELSLKLPLDVRQKLVARNKSFLEKTREALTQEYQIPSHLTPYNYPYTPPLYESHQVLLDFVAKTYADSGNKSEAMRCALDSMELGAVLPGGGGFRDRETGNRYERQGRQLASSLTEDVDAKTAREAVARLERIEARRWPLSKNLRVQLRQAGVAYKLATFAEGPVYMWELLRLNSNGPQWDRVSMVYGGPKALVEASENCVKEAQTRLEGPWQPNQPMMLNAGRSATSYPLYSYFLLEVVEYAYRTQTALLKTRLALRAYKLEHGSYPESLDTLVAAGYLKAVPGDPFSPTRAPLRYLPSAGAFTLWSVGPDGVDDRAGARATGRYRRPADQFLSADMVGDETSIMAGGNTISL